MTGTTVARKAGESTALWVLGGLYEVKVSSEESGGACTVMEFTIPPGYGPPPHSHDCAEIVYVIEGKATFHIGDETVEGTAGAVFYFAPGTRETFEPEGGPMRALVTYLPGGGIDKFFREIGEPALSRTIPPPSETAPDFPAIVAAGEKYGLHIAT